MTPAFKPVDALGLLTILSYGSWFYGFGVLVDDVGTGLGLGIGVLGVVYGLTTLCGGIAAVFAARHFDGHGAGRVLSTVGPLAATLYGVASYATNPLVFCLAFVVSGAAISASGFYSFTQPLSISLRPAEHVRMITRLTIWGAFSSPIMIPLTEAIRGAFGWRAAMRVSAVLLIAAFVAAHVATRNVHEVPRSSSRSIRAAVVGVAGSRFLRFYALAILTASMSVSSLLVFQVPVMKWAGLSASAAAGFAGGRGLLQLLGRIPLIPVVDRFGAWRVQVACRGAVGMGAASLWLSGQLPFAVIYVVVIGASAGALSAIDGIVAREILPDTDFATLAAVLGLIGTVGSALGPALVGTLAQVVGSMAVVPGVVLFGGIGSALLQIMGSRSRPTAESS